MSALSLQPSAALEDVKLLNSLSNDKKSRFLTSCRMFIWRNRKTLRNVSMEDKRGHLVSVCLYDFSETVTLHT